MYQRIPLPFTTDRAKEFVERLCSADWSESPRWAIVYRGAVSGIVSVNFELEHRIGALGYGLHSSLRGAGACVEACAVVVDAAFRNCDDLHRFRAHTDARNVASMRVLEKLGFSHEGTLRSNQMANGELVDEAIFGLLRNEWRE